MDELVVEARHPDVGADAVQRVAARVRERPVGLYLPGRLAQAGLLLGGQEQQPAEVALQHRELHQVGQRGACHGGEAGPSAASSAATSSVNGGTPGSARVSGA